jgi:hypothetical protein
MHWDAGRRGLKLNARTERDATFIQSAIADWQESMLKETSYIHSIAHEE